MHSQDRTPTVSTLPSRPAPVVLGRFPAGGPYGNKPAETFAAQLRAEGTPATVTMDLATDDFLVKVVA